MSPKMRCGEVVAFTETAAYRSSIRNRTSTDARQNIAAAQRWQALDAFRYTRSTSMSMFPAYAHATIPCRDGPRHGQMALEKRRSNQTT